MLTNLEGAKRTYDWLVPSVGSFVTGPKEGSLDGLGIDSYPLREFSSYARNSRFFFILCVNRSCKLLILLVDHFHFMRELKIGKISEKSSAPNCVGISASSFDLNNYSLTADQVLP